MRAALSIVLFLLLVLPARAEHYTNPIFKFSFEYPSGLNLSEDRDFLRKIMNYGTNELVDPKLQPEVQEMLRNVGPQFMLQAADGSNLLCVTSLLGAPEMNAPMLTLARSSVDGALKILPTARVLLEPHEVRMGDNLMVRHDLQIQMGDIPMRQAQFLVRNTETGMLFLFGVTGALDGFDKSYPRFEGILKTLKLDFPTGPRVEV